MDNKTLPDTIVHYYNGEKITLQVAKNTVHVKSPPEKFKSALYGATGARDVSFPKSMDGVFSNIDLLPDGIQIEHIRPVNIEANDVVVWFSDRLEPETLHGLFSEFQITDFDYTFSHENQSYLGKGAVLLYTSLDITQELLEQSCPALENIESESWTIIKSEIVDNLFIAQFKNHFIANKIYAHLYINRPDWLLCVDMNYYTFDSGVNRLNYDYSTDLIESTQLPDQEAYSRTKTFEAHQHFSGHPDIKIAIFDTGIYDNHPDLLGASITGTGHNLVPLNNRIHDLIDIVRPSKYNTHGTNCAGLACGHPSDSQGKGVVGVGKGCSFVDVRIGYNIDGELHLDMLRLIEAFYISGFGDNAVHVISCSFKLTLGFECLERIIDKIVNEGRDNNGVSVVFAAGNDDSSITFPAMLDSIITVSASDNQNKPKTKQVQTEENNEDWGSNFGAKVDLAAPGTGLITTSNPIVTYGNPKGYRKNFNGTSAAAPQVAGCIGLMLSKKTDLKPKRIKELLRDNTSSFKGENNQKYGTGILNVYKTLLAIN
ncbi:MAG: S8 family serine peptidase [Gilvibacter sp.]